MYSWCGHKNCAFPISNGNTILQKKPKVCRKIQGNLTIRVQWQLAVTKYTRSIRKCRRNNIYTQIFTIKIMIATTHQLFVVVHFESKESHEWGYNYLKQFKQTVSSFVLWWCLNIILERAMHHKFWSFCNWSLSAVYTPSYCSKTRPKGHFYSSPFSAFLRNISIFK